MPTPNLSPPSDSAEPWLRFAFLTLLGQSVALPTGPVPVDDLNAVAILPLIDWAIHERCDDVTLPCGYVVGESEVLALHHQVRKSAIEPALTGLTEQGLRYRLCKGMAASLTVYAGREECRFMGDVDLMVDGASMDAVVATFVEQGFRLDSHPKTVTDARVYQLTMSKDIGQFVVAVDIHRGLHNPPLHKTLMTQMMAAVPTITDDGLSVLSTPYSLVASVIHRIKNNHAGDHRELIDCAYRIAKMSDEEWHQTQTILKEARLWKLSKVLARQCDLIVGDSDPLLKARLLAWMEIDGASSSTPWDQAAFSGLTPKARGSQSFLDAYKGYFPEPRLAGQAILAMLSYATHRSLLR